MRIPLLISCAFLLRVTASADVVTLKDGTRITGDVQSGGQQILIKLGDASRVVPADQIQSIELGSSEPPASPRASAAVAQSQTPERITLLAGTEIAART